jgi:tRNA A-37 threonylcarbamoyl transferase component Bud32/tetratricopeptide (TPR) repeat protein
MNDIADGHDEALDGAMAEAFREGETHGVLDELGAGASKILLREPPSDAPSPLLRPIDAGRTGRYQVLGEIARGGVGVVLKGHDVDLGRDVAMKVLREEHAGNADVLQRFVEEAQIGGQLQHPGIVPVYELGLRADKRPWFSMKLVKGRTLSALLAERKDVAQDRRRYVGIFEQVCQTMAYAHSRGVVHRDLKPSNIMVGAFGEVQVVDWGLAKVLRQGGVADERRAQKAPDVSVIATVRTGSVGSESVVGSVLGTPAYMPPEQARGIVDALDERSDVFSLGAVLCEILTGKPPYVSATGTLIAMAAKADLADAHARLDGCGADEELVAIARSCLLPAREARPANAGELAKSVGEHLASIEERAKASQIEAAEARTRAEEADARAAVETEKRAQERRARRMTVALAAVVLVAVVAGGLAWRSAELSRLDREHAAEATFASAMDEAELLRRRAESGQDLRLWDEAELAAKRADAAARTADAPSSVGARLATFHASFDARLRDVRAAERTFQPADELVRSGDWRGLAETCRRAIALNPKRAEYHRQLATALFRVSDRRGAVRAARTWVELEPESANAHYRFGGYLARFGEYEAALVEFERAARIEPSDLAYRFSRAGTLANLERWDESDAGYRDILLADPDYVSASTNMKGNERSRPIGRQDADAFAGKHPEFKSADWIVVGMNMVWHGRFADAVRAYETWMQLFTAEVDKVWECNRYNAACFAARAGAGEGRVVGPPLDDAAKAAFRAKARKWLAADVAEWKHLAEAGGNVPPTNMIKNLAWAKEDGDLAPIRDEEFTSKWPEEERKACAALWADVDALLAMARTAAPAAK